MNIRLMLAFGLALAFPLLAHAEDDAVVGINAEALKKSASPAATAPAPLDSRDRGRLRRVEDYFNTIRTLKADFTQTVPDGRQAHGVITIARPGKMRLEYAPPSKDLVVADGTFIHVWDDAAQTSSSVPIGSSLADVILRDHFTFSGDIKVLAVRYFPSMMEIDVTQEGNPTAGKLTLEFQDNPLKLRNWRVVDATGQETRVALSHDEVNTDLPSSTFYYRDPNFGKIKK